MRRLLLGLALALLLAGCGQVEAEPPVEDPEETEEYAALIAATPVAQVEGETISPDGRFEVRTEGASGEYVSGVQPPEFLQIVDRETGEALWQGPGLAVAVRALVPGGRVPRPGVQRPDLERHYHL